MISSALLVEILITRFLYTCNSLCTSLVNICVQAQAIRDQSQKNMLRLVLVYMRILPCNCVQAQAIRNQLQKKMSCLNLVCMHTPLQLCTGASNQRSVAKEYAVPESGVYAHAPLQLYTGARNLRSVLKKLGRLRCLSTETKSCLSAMVPSLCGASSALGLSRCEWFYLGVGVGVVGGVGVGLGV
jgi:hypothetical protein